MPADELRKNINKDTQIEQQTNNKDTQIKQQMSINHYERQLSDQASFA
jgi:hypothetical protein